MVQDPQDALFSDTPAHALTAVKADFVLPLFEIAPTLARLVRKPTRSRTRGRVS
jgi:hypothetical protein